jgi:hypothetical protein
MRHETGLWLALLLMSLEMVGCSREEADPRFIRYYGAQPKCEVRLMPGSTNGDVVESVVDRAKARVRDGRYWPEPVSVVEREEVWWVGFKLKERVVLVDGREVIQTQVPGGVTVEVPKDGSRGRRLPAR